MTVASRAILPEQVTFDGATHTYRAGNRVLPSVTQVGDWMDAYAGVPADVMALAADRGQAVHLACELDDADDLGSVPDVIEPYVEAWRALKRETGAVIYATEGRVVDPVYGYVGTLDRVAAFPLLKRWKPADLAIVEIKATAALPPSAGPQTAGYLAAWNAHAYPDMPGKGKCNRRFVAQLRADGTYRLHECTDVTDRAVFLAGLTLFNWRSRVGFERHDTKEQT